MTTLDRDRDLSEGVAIGSVYETAAGTHVEPVRYGAGSGFWRLLMSPIVGGRSALTRVVRALWDLVRHPLSNARVYLVRDWARRTQVLLFMKTHEGTLQMVRRGRRVTTRAEEGPPPSAAVPEIVGLAERFAEKVEGKPMVLLTETLMGTPTTAHFLGGCTMGRDSGEGVIDSRHRLFGYPGLYICDGSAVSANPGMNPSLTITALAERAMSFLPAKE